MDRRALLLYLQNVRDLEVARHQIGIQFASEKERYEYAISNIQVEAKTIEFKEEKKEWGGCLYTLCICYFVFCLFADVIWIYCLLTGVLEPAGHGDYAWVWLLLISSSVISGALTIALGPEPKSSYNKRMKKKEMEIEAYNSDQNRIAQDGKKKRERLQNEWAQRSNWYKSEYAKVTDLLLKFYNMNILENPFRDLKSTIYLYEYMSTGQASFEEAKMHAHMEDGICRIEERFDAFFKSVLNHINETRVWQKESQAKIQHTIQQNNQMLDYLQDISSNSQEAAYYSALSSNYSKANAYFSLANYLKR